MNKTISVIALLALIVGMTVAMMDGVEPQNTLAPIDGDQILERLAEIFADFRIYACLTLIFVDLGLGVAAALRMGTFEWGKVGQFYQTNVLPYFLGYLVLYVALHTATDMINLGSVGDWISDMGTNVAWGAFVVTLGDSILQSIKKLGYVKASHARRQ